MFYKQARGANEDYLENHKRSELVWDGFPIIFFSGISGGKQKKDHFILSVIQLYKQA